MSDKSETNNSSVCSESFSPHKKFFPVDSDYRITRKNVKHALESGAYFPKHIQNLMDCILAWQPMQGSTLATLQYETTKHLDYLYTTLSEDSLESFLEVYHIFP